MSLKFQRIIIYLPVRSIIVSSVDFECFIIINLESFWSYEPHCLALGRPARYRLWIQEWMVPLKGFNWITNCLLIVFLRKCNTLACKVCVIWFRVLVYSLKDLDLGSGMKMLLPDIYIYIYIYSPGRPKTGLRSR